MKKIHYVDIFVKKQLRFEYKYAIIFNPAGTAIVGK